MKSVFEFMVGQYYILVVFSRIRFFCWPFFGLGLYGFFRTTSEMASIYYNLMPWESFYGALGILDTVRLYCFVPITFYTFYLGYRCFANEYDPVVIAMNQDINKGIFQAIGRF